MKKILSITVLLIVVGGGAFYGGMKYAESARQNFAGRNFGGQDTGMNGDFRVRPGGQQGNGFVSGEILAEDDKSITVKLRDGGSRIVFFSASTEITKSVSGSVDDLEVGKTVIVGGKQNSDGSFTAETVQLRSNLLPPGN